MAARAPDYIEPTVGWRIWDVVESGGALRLCSVAFRTIWRPRRRAVALCRRSPENLAWSGLRDHAAPHPACSCGVYGLASSRDALVYLSRSHMWRWTAIHRIVGTVSLWGAVVEGASGWRASRAYPAALYVPEPRSRLRSFLSGLPRPSLPVEEIAFALADYGVPIEIVDCGTTRELATTLAAVPAAKTVVESTVPPSASGGGVWRDS